MNKLDIGDFEVWVLSVSEGNDIRQALDFRSGEGFKVNAEVMKKAFE